MRGMIDNTWFGGIQRNRRRFVKGGSQVAQTRAMHDPELTGGMCVSLNSLFLGSARRNQMPQSVHRMALWA